MFKLKVRNVHFIGIGGIGISGLAYLFNKEGYNVSGSDIRGNELTSLLKNEGVRIFIKHSEGNIKDAEVIIRSTAVKDSNPEIKAAKEKGIPVIPRCDALSELMRFKEGVAVAGTHGKTTTSSMISKIFIDAKIEPTVLIGGKVDFLDFKNAHYGKSNIMVAETDESDGTFLKILPSISVITNIDADHLDFYKSITKIKESFVEFANRTSFYGKVFLCGECKNAMEIIPSLCKKTVTYGLNPSFNFYGKNIRINELSSRFDIFYNDKKLDSIKLPLPGKHNILNAIAAVAVGLEAGIPISTIKESLATFKNAKRRLEIKGKIDDILIIDDYGHHPTEIEETYKSLKTAYPGKRIVVLFQPHRFSRTATLWDGFIKTLEKIDHLYITDIYPAGESPLKNISAENLAKITGKHYCGDLRKSTEIVLSILQPGDILLTVGAGTVYRAGEEILRHLKEGKPLHKPQ